MCALKVTRSTMAATRRGSGKTVPHSLKGRLVAIAMEARSSRSVMIWNSSFGAAGVDFDVPEFVEAEQVEAAVAADHPGQLSFVGSLDELVHQLRRGDVADPATLLAGSKTKTDQQMGLAGAAVAEQYDRFAGVHVVSGGELAEGGGLDSRDGVDVEVGEAFEPWELGVVDAPGAAAFAAVVDLGGELAEGGGLDSRDGVDVEVGEAFEPWELGVVDAPGAAAFAAVVDLGG